MLTEKEKTEFINSIADPNVREKINEERYLLDTIKVPLSFISRIGICKERGKARLVFSLKGHNEIYEKSITD